MVKEIVFHLGDKKTGSTSIQAVLRNATIRAERTIGYPVFRLHHSHIPRAILAPHAGKGIAAHFAKLRTMIEASDRDIQVISAENFEGVYGSQLLAAMEEFMPEYLPHVRLIAYVRPHADRIVSSWSEQIKTGNFSGTLEEFFERNTVTQRFAFHERFKSWRDAFGDRFELRPMVRSLLHKEDVVQDFVSYVLQSEDFTIEGETAANESLTLEDLAVMRMVNEKLGDVYSDLRQRDRTGKNENLGKREIKATYPANNATAIARNFAINLAAHKRDHGTKPAFHTDLVTQVQDHYAADAAALDDTFFDGTPMTDALQAITKKAVPEPQILDANALLTPEEIRLAQVMTDFIGRVALIAPKDWIKFFPVERNGAIYDILASKGGFNIGDVKPRKKDSKLGSENPGKDKALD